MGIKSVLSGTRQNQNQSSQRNLMADAFRRSRGRFYFVQISFFISGEESLNQKHSRVKRGQIFRSWRQRLESRRSLRQNRQSDNQTHWQHRGIPPPPPPRWMLHWNKSQYQHFSQWHLKPQVLWPVSFELFIQIQLRTVYLPKELKKHPLAAWVCLLAVLIKRACLYDTASREPASC